MAVAGCIVVSGVAAYVAFTAVPTRELQAAGTWMDAEQARTEKISEDATIRQMIAAARRDFFLSPRNWIGQSLNYVEARSVPPNDVYLLFWPGRDVHTIIVYRGTRESGRLLWKAPWAQ